MRKIYRILIIALGLFLISGSFILKIYFKVPDFINGFLKGFGAGIIVIALIRQWFRKKHKRPKFVPVVNDEEISEPDNI